MNIIILWTLLSTILFVNCNGVNYTNTSFPWQQFINGHQNRSFASGIFPIEEFLCELNSTSLACRCDPECFHRHDCCIDQFWSESQHSGNLTRYVIDFTKKYKKLVRTLILPSLFTKQNGISENATDKLMMVTTCDDEFGNEVIIQSCLSNENLTNDAIIPIIDKHGVIYKNVFCAICNSVNEYKYGNLTVACEPIAGYVENASSVLLNVTVVNKHCKISLVGHSRKKMDIEDESKNPNCQSMLCHLYFGRYCLYNNYLCAHCRNSVNRFCSSGNIGMNTIQMSMPYRYTSSMLVDFKKQKTTECNTAGLRALIIGECVHGFCQSGYEYTNAVCVRKEEESYLNFGSGHTNKTWTLLGCLKHTKPSISIVKKQGQEIETIQKLVATINNSFTINHVFHNAYLFRGKIQNITSTLNYISQNKTLWKTISAVYLSVGNMEQLNSQIYGYRPKHAFSNSRICARPVEIKDPITVTNTCHVVSQSTNRTYFAKRYNIIHVISRNATNTTIYTCEKFHLSSSCVQVKIDNYTIDKDTLTLRSSLFKKRELGVSQYVPYKNGVAVCRTEIKEMESTWINKLVHVEMYVIIIGTSISIAFIVFLLWQFRYVKEKTLPHFDATALCICLLLSDLIIISLMSWSSPPTGCYIIAVTFHWLLLTTHVFAALISLNFAKTFIHIGTTVENVRVEFCKHVIFSVFLSLCITLPPVILDKMGVLKQSGYGGNGICWITSLTVRVYFYILPSGFLYLISVISLSFAVIKIRSVNVRNTSVMRRKDKQRYTTRTISFKFILMLGIVEILGFIQIPNKDLTKAEETVNAISAFLFTFMRSFRGAILAGIYLQKMMRPPLRTIMKKMFLQSAEGQSVSI